MEPDTNSTFLTPVLEVQTQTAFPERVDFTAEFKPSDRKIQLRICSEFVNHLTAVEVEQDVSQLALHNDHSGQPMIFGIKSTNATEKSPARKRLVVFVHVDGAQQAWQLYDITPGDEKTEVEAFASHLTRGNLHMAVAVKASDNLSDLFHATVPVPDLKWDSTIHKAVPDLQGQVLAGWTNVSQRGSERRKILSLACGRSGTLVTKTAPFQISVGTAAIPGFRASHFFVDPSPEVAQPWTSLPIPQDSPGVIQMAGAVTEQGQGTYIMYHSPEAVGGGAPGSAEKTAIVQLCVDGQGQWTQSVSLILAKLGGKAYHMSSSVNVHGKTDLFVASDNGIAFYPWSDIRIVDPQIILPGMRFRQVFASESLDPSYSSKDDDSALNFANITVLAVTDAQDLLFIRGKRMLESQIVTFEASGLGLRSKVEHLACFYNRARNVDELVYVTEKADRLVHLARDPGSLCWHEHIISVPHDSIAREFPAYLSTITVTDAAGSSVGAGYEVDLTAESVFVNINNKTYTLDHRPTRVKTDGSGRITVVTATNLSLEASAIEISLPLFNDGQKYSCHPAQRVMRVLSTMKDEKSIKDARSTTGSDPFAAKRNDQKAFDSNVKSSADMLAMFPSMVHQVDSAAGAAILPGHSASATEIVMSWARDAEGILKSIGGEWLEDIGEVIHFIGDAIEWVKNKVQTAYRTIYRCAVRIMTKALEFVVEVGGKVIRWVVNKVGPLIRSIANFLRDYLGIDMNGMLDWLALMFDTKMIKETQEKLNDFVGTLRLQTKTFFEVNESTLKDSFEGLKKKLEPIIKDHRPKHDASKAKDNPALKALNWLLDNPVLETIRKYSPIFWILEAEEDGILEGLENSLEVPDCSILFRTMEEVTKSILDENIVAIWDLIAEAWDTLQSVLTDPSTASTKIQELLFDVFWTMFDSIKSIVVGMYKLVAAVVEQFFEVLMGHWKVPLLTTAFEAWADQPYSFLNMATYGLAQVLHIFFQAIFKKKPFEVLGDPSALFDGWTKETLDMHDFLGVPRSGDNMMLFMAAAPSPQTTHNDLDVNNVAENFEVRVADVDNRYREAIEWHNRVSPWIGMLQIAGQVSSSIIGIATFKFFKGKIDKKIASRKGYVLPKTDITKATALRQATCIMSFAGSSLVLIGRATQMQVFLRAIQISPRLSKEWNSPELHCGYIVPMLCSLAGTACQLANFKTGAQELTILGNCLHQVGDIVQQICLYLVFQQPASQAVADNPWGEQKAKASLRLTGDGTGIVASIASKWKENEFGAAVMGTFMVISLTHSGTAFVIEKDQAMKPGHVVKH